MTRRVEQFSDEELISAISKGNDKAFDHLFRTYFQNISLYAYSIIANTETAEDIAQESFMKIWNARHILTHVKNIKAYLYKITYNECMTWLSKQKNKAAEPLNNANSIPANIDLNRHIIIAETIHELHKVVALLSPRVRQVFQLYYLEGLSTEEISRLLNTSAKTVMNQRKNALKVIRQAFMAG